MVSRISSIESLKIFFRRGVLATVITLMGGMVAAALFPLLSGGAAAFVAYGRWRLAPIVAKTLASTARA